MSKVLFFAPMMAIAVAGSLAFVDSTSAQTKKKVSYEQAFKLCKNELDKSGVVGVGFDAKARSTAGAACMHKHGYRLKRSTSF